MSLEVPEVAIEKAREVAMRTGSTRASVVAAAPLIVAAELERLAATFASEAAGTDGGYWDGMSAAEDIVRRRASVLRGEGDQ